MVMKKDRRKVDIKSKLVAAIAMLMVSCIMVVSSTYAWFTLSTAPEVTGISTAIGANGNLEMSLLPGFNGENTYESVADALKAIGNATGNQTTVQKNTTWGNLVDLSDDSYGLNQISLYPSKLGLSEGKLADYYLGTPQYGADGRFMGVATSASAAAYKNGTFGTNAFGVRAVGTSSGMTAHELAYRDMLSSANDAFNKAITKTKDATSLGGSQLASLAVKKALDSNAVFTSEDIGKLINAYDGLAAALELVESAMTQYVIAYVLGNSNLSENTYLVALESMKNMSLDELMTYTADEMDRQMQQLLQMKADIAENRAILVDLEGDSFTWAQISTCVFDLADIDSMKLNGESMSHWMEKENGEFVHINDLIGQMSNLVLTVGGPGFYADLADFVGTFTTPVTISGMKYGAMTVDNLSATMKVNATAGTDYLATAKTAASTYPQDAFGTGGGSSISDFYGYIIDMAFRTNAAGSSLQLQTEAVDRVYADNESNQYTMGGGSSMTFSVEAVEGFGTDELKNLMGFIRVVFFNPADNTIFGYARLDVNTAVVNGSSVTMQLKMWDENANDKAGAWAESSVITALDQNKAQAVSTLVYLDGEKISNADVANAELTGTMNIQFSSTAELKPMEYGDLRNGDTEPQSEYGVKVNGVTLEEKVQAGKTYTANVSAFATYVPEGKVIDTITVTMGGNAVENAYDASTSTVTVPNVNGDLVVTITFKDAEQGTT